MSSQINGMHEKRKIIKILADVSFCVSKFQESRSPHSEVQGIGCSELHPAEQCWPSTKASGTKTRIMKDVTLQRKTQQQEKSHGHTCSLEAVLTGQGLSEGDRGKFPVL